MSLAGESIVEIGEMKSSETDGPLRATVSATGGVPDNQASTFGGAGVEAGWPSASSSSSKLNGEATSGDGDVAGAAESSMATGCWAEVSATPPRRSSRSPEGASDEPLRAALTSLARGTGLGPCHRPRRQARVRSGRLSHRDPDRGVPDPVPPDSSRAPLAGRRVAD
jgi:hypothetical protein